MKLFKQPLNVSGTIGRNEKLLWPVFHMVGNKKIIPKNVSNTLLCRNAKKHPKQTRRAYAISEFRKDETKPRSKQNKQSTKTPTRQTIKLRDLESVVKKNS